MAREGWGNPKLDPAPKVVSSGSVSKPVVPAWRPRPQPAFKRVQASR